MLIYVGEPHYKLVAVQEGTGDNLTNEDIEHGYVDYVMTSIYRVEGEDIVLEDSGQMLSRPLIKDLEEDELVRRVFDYWELGDPESREADYVILEH